MEILRTVWSVVNTPAGVTFVASIALYILNKVYAAKPLWKKYEGTLIAAVKFAEKEIPDGSAIKAVARLDAALKYALKVIEAAEGQLPPKKIAEVKEGLQITHANLEKSGGLSHGSVAD